jgi:drug/metabolite transporter (DMT)-like permease
VLPLLLLVAVTAVWGALIVTGVFASALGYLIQVWAQRRISATGSPSSSRSRLCGPASSATSEPAAAEVLRRFVRAEKARP